MTKTIKSFTSNAKYFATIDDETGLMTDCRCPDHALYCPNRAGGCKHMKAFNAEVKRAEKFRELWHALDFRSEAQRDERANRRAAYEMSLGY